VVADLTKEGWTAQEVASAVALWMGVYGMILGFLKLGFLLDFISYPVLTGFISAVAITIIVNQMDSLLGEDGVRDGNAKAIHDIFAFLPKANGYTCAVGFTGILFLFLLEQAGKRWGQKYKVIWFLSILRAFLCLAIFTGVSYAVNKKYDNPDDYIFEVTQVKSDGIHASVPKSDLISKTATRSIAAFVGSALEHVAIARGFSVKNNYSTDASQELAYYGVANFFNSFFQAMGVGGAMSRTAVNSSCNVKSPLSGFVTTAVVLVSIFELMGVLYWIPKATLAAIVITAVWPLIGVPSTYWNFYKASLADFIAAMIAFWVSLFYTTEVGIASAVGFNIVYVMLRQVFKRVTTVGVDTQQADLAAPLDAANAVPHVPADARVFQFHESWFFPNAFRMKTSILDTIETYHCPQYSTVHGTEAERNWSVEHEQRVNRLRKRAGIVADDLPPIKIVVLDFTKCNFTDVTAVKELKAFMNELKKYAGKQVSIRFACMSDQIRERFERGRVPMADADSSQSSDESGSTPTNAVKVYRTVADALKRREVLEIHVKGDDEKV
jgi:solute carrier family 26 (sodium-independent sulfate anion transporter), member 11